MPTRGSTSLQTAPPIDDTTRAGIRAAIRGGPAAVLAAEAAARGRPLRPMPVDVVRVGTTGGLPFEFLSTDLHSGCLPNHAMCYGNCPQGLLTVQQGFDFGDRKLNTFDESVIRRDLAALDPAQRWIRQGWNSDVAFSEEAWGRAARLAELLSEHGLHLVLLTKIFKVPEAATLDRLAATSAEVRVSISALDEDSQLERRLSFLDAYRSAGGQAVPYLMTASYRTPALASRQAALVEWIRDGDFPGAEHPLRFNESNALSAHLDPERVLAHPKFPEQRWSGRLYPDALPMPAPPSLKPSYRGIGAGRASRVDWQAVAAHFDHGTPTHRALHSGTADLDHPNLHRHGTLDLSKAHPCLLVDPSTAGALETAAAQLQRVPEEPTSGLLGAYATASRHLHDHAGVQRFFARLHDEVRSAGFAVVQGLPFDDGDRLLLLVGSVLGAPARYLGQPLVRAIAPVPGMRASAYYAGADAVRLHTDKAFVPEPPRFVLLQCVRPDPDGGGEVTLSDARSAFDALSPRAQAALRTAPVTVKLPGHIERDGGARLTVANDAAGRAWFRLRADVMHAPDDPELARALTAFGERLEAAVQRIPLAPGELMVMDNGAIAHGRTALGGGTASKRHCRRLLVAASQTS